jgi:hypothetical protein
VIEEIRSAIFNANSVLSTHPKLFYEPGIAHTFGKLGVLIAQSMSKGPHPVPRAMLPLSCCAGAPPVTDPSSAIVSKEKTAE